MVFGRLVDQSGIFNKHLCVIGGYHANAHKGEVVKNIAYRADGYIIHGGAYTETASLVNLERGIKAYNLRFATQ